MMTPHECVAEVPLNGKLINHWGENCGKIEKQFVVIVGGI
jgi:hypothetical protein